MTNALWFLLIGLLMLTRGMTSTVLSKVPFTSAIISRLIALSAVRSSRETRGATLA